MPDPQLLRAKGHPVKSRIRNEMDGVRREQGSRRENSTLGRFNRGSDVECVMKKGITVEDVPIPVGL